MNSKITADKGMEFDEEGIMTNTLGSKILGKTEVEASNEKNHGEGLDAGIRLSASLVKTSEMENSNIHAPDKDAKDILDNQRSDAVIKTAADILVGHSNQETKEEMDDEYPSYTSVLSESENNQDAKDSNVKMREHGRLMSPPEVRKNDDRKETWKEQVMENEENNSGDVTKCLYSGKKEETAAKIEENQEKETKSLNVGTALSSSEV
jgi:hypothetical protein